MGVVIYHRVINVFEIPSNVMVQCVGRGLCVNSDIKPLAFEVALGDGLTFDNDSRVCVKIGQGLSIDEDGSLCAATGATREQVTVDDGSGLEIDDNRCLSLSVGSGLKVDDTNKLTAALGKSLYFDQQQNINVSVGGGLSHSMTADTVSASININVGKGLSVDEQNVLNVNIGNGLSLSTDNKIETDLVVDPSQTTVQTVLTDSSLILDGQMLSLRKTYVEYVIERNASGLVVNVGTVNTWQETDEVMLGVCYGYGYGYGYGGSGYRPIRPNTPAFPNFYR